MTAKPEKFSTALNDALLRADMPLMRLFEVLERHGTPVGLSTLSYWRSGQRTPEGEVSLRAVRTIEEVLGLDPDTLSRLLPTGDRRRTPRTGTFPISASDEALLRLAAELGFVTLRDDFVERSTTIRLEVGADRTLQKCVVHAALVALGDGASRLPIALTLGSPGFSANCLAPAGFRMGRRVADAETGTVMAELLTERALHEGETVFLEQQVDLDGIDDREWIYRMPSRVGIVTILVQFDPEDLPTVCQEVVNVSGVEEVAPLRRLGPSVSASRSDVGPGHFGIRWEWTAEQADSE